MISLVLGRRVREPMSSRGRGAVIVSGELKQWHDVVLTFDGPDLDEASEPNPFLDYRLDVYFCQRSDTSHRRAGLLRRRRQRRTNRGDRRQQVAGPLPAAGAGDVDVHRFVSNGSGCRHWR